MSGPTQRLYDLLPSYVRFRDQQLRDPELEVAPLEALLKALELPLHALEENVEALYRGWFIETCDLWRVPYVADLLGVRGLDEAGALIPSQRRRVANAIAYRRRKGTPAAFARAAEDATGWACHVTELRDLTAATQALGAPLPGRPGTADLRALPDLEELTTAIDRHAHTADLREPRASRPAPPGTGFRPDAVAFTFWRLESYPVTGAAARRSARSPRRFRFHPAGVDTALFNAPETPTGTVYRTRPRHLPAPLSRRALAREVASRRRGEVSADGYLSPSPAFRIWVPRDGDAPADEGAEREWSPIAPEEIEIRDLTSWDEPDRERAKVAVDPETGRLAFPEPGPDRVRVDYSYGSSCDLGGGPYPRLEPPAARGGTTWRAIVDLEKRPSIEEGVLRFDSLREALDVWRATAAKESSAAVIRIDDSGHHRIGDLEIELPAGYRLTIRADQRRWPHLEGDVTVRGEAGGWLELDGLGVEGRLTLAGEPSLALVHSTVYPPGEAPVAIDHRAAPGEPCRSEVEIEHSILVGGLRLPAAMPRLTVVDSVVDAGEGVAIQGVETGEEAAAGTPTPPGPPARIERSTIFGEVWLHQLWLAANALFTGRVTVARTREGQALHSYFPTGSTTPPRQHCLEGPRTAGGRWLRPAFTSTTYGHPGYAQLTACCGEIRYGGEQGNEMGVFHGLSQSDRLANLQAVLDEQLPAGLTPRISFAT